MPAFPDWLLPGSVWSLAGRAAELAFRIPANLIGALGLATKHDVDSQNRITRKKTVLALRELRDTQREHIQRLELLRAELREDLQSFAAAIDDQLFALERPDPRKRLALDPEFDDDLDDDEDGDEIDLVSYDAILAAEDGIDLSDLQGYEIRSRRSALDD